jgi:hypothetical protein
MWVGGSIVSFSMNTMILVSRIDVELRNSNIYGTTSSTSTIGHWLRRCTTSVHSNNNIFSAQRLKQLHTKANSYKEIVHKLML